VTGIPIQDPPAAELPVGTPASEPTCGADGTCSGHGTCDKGTCACDAPWHGFACDLMSCKVDEASGQECAGNGMCNSVDGSCECAAGFAGETCADRVCLVECGEHGKCDATGQCVCQQGWAGQNCKLP